MYRGPGAARLWQNSDYWNQAPVLLALHSTLFCWKKSQLASQHEYLFRLDASTMRWGNMTPPLGATPSAS